MLHLTGCVSSSQPATTVIEKVVYQKPTIAEETLTCKALPTVPAVTMQSEVASYILELYESASDCFKNLEAVRAVLK